MLAAYLTGALICASALAAGQAAMALCGRDHASPLAPAVGLSLLVIVANLAIKLPGRATTAAVALGFLLLASLGVLAWRARAGSLGRLVIPAVLAALLAAAVVSIPFLVNGRVGPLGQGLVNDDMASHLLFTDWVATHLGRTPDLVSDGYPLGPHSLVAAVAEGTGAGYVEMFGGLTLAIAGLAAVTAYAALDTIRSAWLRAGAAVLAALPYLAAAWLAQGAFKEPLLALFVIGFALGLRERRPGALPLGLIAAGTLFAYSFPGLAWLATTGIVWALLERQRIRELAPVAGLTAVVVGLAAIPELGRLRAFASFGAFDPEGSGPKVGFGNLRHALSPLEGLNLWPSSDFRVDAASASLPAPLFYLGGAIAAAALAWGIAVAVRRRDSWLLSPLVATAVIYLGARIGGTPYTSAKALVIFAPVAMLIALRGLLDSGGPWGGHRVPAGTRAAPPGPPRAQALALQLLVLAFVIGAAISSFLPLRSGAVGPPTHADELASFRSTIGRGPVLYLGRDQFAAWELFHARLGTPVLNHYNQKGLPSRFPSNDEQVKLDFDALTPQQLDLYPYAVTTAASYQSEPPPNFELVRSTPDYLLWKRTGPTAPRETLDEPDGPGAVLDCKSAAGRALLRRGGGAVTYPAPPVAGTEAGWSPSSRVTDSRSASQQLTLSPGRWAISLQYVATQDARLTAPGLDAKLPANLDFRGPSSFWPAGEITVPAGGPVRFTLSVDRPPLLGRLLHADALAFPLQIAARPVGLLRVVPVASACGRYVDYITPSAGR
jgi:hypothetical protein